MREKNGELHKFLRMRRLILSLNYHCLSEEEDHEVVEKVH